MDNIHVDDFSPWECANLNSDTTGIGGVLIWVTSGGCRLNGPPRIRVSRVPIDDREIQSTITLDDPMTSIGEVVLTEEESDKIHKWIDLNYNAILGHWDDISDIGDLLGELVKV
jgi:hypothetical protein